MIDEMMLSEDAAGIVSTADSIASAGIVSMVFTVFSPVDRFRIDSDARRSQELHMSVNFAAGVFTLRRSVLVGCGIRPGHCTGCNLASVFDVASAMPS